jgi:hypothetical protein
VSGSRGPSVGRPGLVALAAVDSVCGGAWTAETERGTHRKLSSLVTHKKRPTKFGWRRVDTERVASVCSQKQPLETRVEVVYYIGARQAGGQRSNGRRGRGGAPSTGNLSVTQVPKCARDRHGASPKRNCAHRFLQASASLLSARNLFESDAMGRLYLGGQRVPPSEVREL